MNEELRPKVGVGVMVVKEGKVLLQLRGAGSSHGAGEYSFPGGHLEYMESVEACARRETLEESGIEIDNPRLLLVYNMKTHPPLHFLGVNVLADWKSGEPKVIEPDKTVSWGWYDLNDLPSPIFDPTLRDIETYKSGNWPCFIDG
ncbi:MAG: NUDIX domain-containing protein [Patescibacteria group bacterium]